MAFFVSSNELLDRLLAIQSLQQPTRWVLSGGELIELGGGGHGAPLAG